MMNIQSSATKKVNVRRMTVIGVLSAISIMLSMIPGIGYIPIGPTNATIMHIPVIIGAIIEGPIVGADSRIYIWSNKSFKSINSTNYNIFCFYESISIYTSKSIDRDTNILYI